MTWHGMLAFVAVAAAAAGVANAQSNSLFKDGKVARPGEDSVRATSLVRVTTRADRIFKKHDLVTIVIREQTKSKTTSDATTDKSATLKATVDALPRFGKLGTPAAITGIAPTSPEVLKVGAQRSFEGGGSKERADVFTESVAAEIVDVKPNGTLVVEARKERQWMGELQILTVTGVVRREDVDERNTVASEDIANLCLSYETRGQVADSAHRGFFDQLLDFLSIF